MKNAQTYKELMEIQILKGFCMVNVFLRLNSLFKEHKSEACRRYKMDPIGGEIPWRLLKEPYLFFIKQVTETES